VVHDWIMGWAGSERTLERMLQVVPQADLVVGVFGPGMRRFNDVCAQARETWLARVPGARRNYQWMLPLEALAFRGIDTSGYDLVISSSHALAKMVRPGRRGVHLSYCYSPPRYLWDLHDVYMARAGLARRLGMAAGRGLMQRLDRHSARGVTHFVGISGYVADRIARAYGRSARVVYPPVEPGDLSSAAREDFVLTLGRLVPYKRVDVIVRAAAVHGRRTVIAGHGPELERLRAIAGPNVEFLGAVSEDEKGRLLATCGTFAFCADEDFGIAPLEANAHGAPVVALRAGAVCETMVDGETGVLFDEPTPEALSAAVQRAAAGSWDPVRLRANAERFAPVRFKETFTQCVEHALAGTTW
jgi:glycosyltransferase involved in cell wall biosynthesis